jgi:hypothetical protein
MHLIHVRWPATAAAIFAAAILTGTLASTTASATPAATASTPLYTSPASASVNPAGGCPGSGVTECDFYTENWAGYLAVQSGSTTSFTNSQTEFSVPSVNCTTTPTGYVGDWAGLGGFYQSSTVQAAGVTAQCSGGTASYDAWWETYPQPQTEEFSVNPGDSISVKVTWDDTSDVHSGQYQFVLDDETTGQSFSLWESCAASPCENTSAEVMSSAPSSAASTADTDVLPLADYAAANFEGSRVANQTGASGSFYSTDWPEYYEFFANNNLQNGGNTASPGPLFGYQSFANTWLAAS